MSDKAYHGLLTSLPHIDSLFDSKITPISRYQLERRLSALSFDERKHLNMIEQIMHWDRTNNDADDAELIKFATWVRSEVKSQVLRELIDWRLDMRSVVAALRRKKAGEKAPAGARWSFGTRYEFIRRNWSAPYFNLHFTFPWLPDVARYMEHDQSLDVEKALLEAVWEQLDRISTKERFSFEAVVIYLLRWNLVSRWTTYNSEIAIERFDQLVESALGEFASELPH
ncbi:DUF2764 domain-containing protein [Photobacterium sp. ZSDE20]|uniref:DUF2764 domain-containing protein n=1 Tax=Photobacterium pectinilyticum TaxID=2906793 RepID=A0ABT1MZC3_9GAMM|nr:DUF2764 family protein [Photobacterium sp. ZSDE20]MCQ1057739.1 DUF2764 domain-containing protein [Photobacterium sp. ZSDE20]MDD1822050.1 DUF2764 domain-containing protein [Photobacterium sp. ZSDE20]